MMSVVYWTGYRRSSCCANVLKEREVMDRSEMANRFGFKYFFGCRTVAFTCPIEYSAGITR